MTVGSPRPYPKGAPHPLRYGSRHIRSFGGVTVAGQPSTKYNVSLQMETESTHHPDAPAPPLGAAPSLPAELVRVSFFGMTATEFDEAVGGWGWPRFRGQQVRDWVYGKRVTDPAAMSNLSKRDQATLHERVAFVTSTVTAQQASNDGTRK